MNFQPELFFIGEKEGKLIATAMTGYEGHRGWINYLAVHPNYQHEGLGQNIMDEAEHKLKSLGCIKINLQVRETNTRIINFYKRLGYKIDKVISLGKRLSI